MNAVLPFDGFLDVLRAKGFAVALREHFALATLLGRWDGTNRVEFRNAIAALIGRNEGEVEGIRRLFDDFYTDFETVPAVSPEPAVSEADVAAVSEAALSPVTKSGRRLRVRWAFGVAAVAIVAAVVVGVTVWRRGQAPQPSPSPAPSAVTPEATPALPPASTLAPPPMAPQVPPRPAPALPAPPSALDARPVAASVGLALLAVLSVLWRVKIGEARRKWLRAAWSAARSSLPGPHYFRVIVRGRAAGLPRAEVEDAATLLGRAFATEARRREIDVPRSIRLTIRRGLLPRFVFRPRRAVQAILVFQDVSQDMEMWRPKVETFLADLTRQGIVFERYYFDGDLRLVTDRPHRAPTPFDLVLRRRSDAPVLVISTGTGLGAVLEHAGERWMRELGSRPLRAWLTPVVDVRLWPGSLRELPLPVWPMTRRGLTQAVRGLVGLADQPTAGLLERVASEGRVSRDDIERMKRLASLVPHPTLDLLDALRLRFAPDVSDAVLAHLFADAESRTAPVLRLSDDEVRRCVKAVRDETPRLEAAVRLAIVETLRASKPPEGSAAHVRWEAALALQELALADLKGADIEAPLATVQALARGPLWEEVRRSAHLVGGTPALEGQIGAALGTGEGGTEADTPPPGMKPPSGGGRPPRTWPGLRELLPAAVAGSLVFVSGQQLGLYASRAVPHVADAYTIEYVPPSEGTRGGLVVRRGGRRTAALPQRVEVYQENRVFRSNVSVTDNLVAEAGDVPLSSNDRGKYYQVRARLPEGNLALSNAVWVPGDALVPVLIDAAPWALVTMTQGMREALREQPTPIVVSVAPGSYHLRFENRGLKLTLDQDISVTSSMRVFQFAMPGFDPTATAATLAGRRR